MRYLISANACDGDAWLTNESRASRYGIPVLEVTRGDVSGTFGPKDIIGEPPPLFCTAQVVLSWGMKPDRTVDERDAARRFLSQWPAGPQLSD